ncbi:MAG: hypothetical protein A3F91_08360 [Flavobacteria bacterium RIFCSPLOWO2_12_FULL_35_11]|nr:MAG: hypothetical protein A3F91_08360 [Flavobacteria bacterium RIFCSPLOWO2_12_FULL_35_11]
MEIEKNYELDFDILVKNAIGIGNRLDGKKYQHNGQNLIYAEGIGQKIIHHILSARHLFHGYQLASDKYLFKPTIDFASIAILTRASLETYLTLNYIFISTTDKDELRFRFLCWDLAGFLERADHTPTNQEHKDKQTQEKKSIKTITEELKNTNAFKNLSTKRQKLATNGQWRLNNSWVQLAVMAGFSERFFKQQYKFLCAYAHSSRLSIIQIQQIKELEAQKEMALASISVLMVIIAKFMFDYIHLIPELNEIKNEPEYAIIAAWKMIGENLK